MAQGYGQPGQTARGRDNQHPHPLYSRSPPESFPGAFLDDFPTPPLRVPVSSSVPRPPPSYPRGTHEAAGPSTPYTTSTDTKRNQPRLVGKRQETITRVTLLNPHSAGTRATSSQSPPKQMASTEELFEFSKVSVGDFERCLAFVESHNALDYRAAADKMLWQAYKTFERLHRRDFDTRHMRLVQKFANQCVQQYALLDFGADCGVESLKRYLHGLVLTSEWSRMDYLTKMLKLPPPNRLSYLHRPIPSYLEKLKWFCLLYDHLYEKIEAEARAKAEKSMLEKFQTKLEGVQARISRGASSTLNSFGSGESANGGGGGNGRDDSISYFVGRAL